MPRMRNDPTVWTRCLEQRACRIFRRTRAGDGSDSDLEYCVFCRRIDGYDPGGPVRGTQHPVGHERRDSVSARGGVWAGHFLEAWGGPGGLPEIFVRGGGLPRGLNSGVLWTWWPVWRKFSRLVGI